MCNNNCNGGLFGNIDWIWIVIAIIVVMCLCGDNCNSCNNNYSNECCC